MTLQRILNPNRRDEPTNGFPQLFGHQVDIRTAEAAVAEDKNRILMSIVKRRQSKNAIGMFSSSKSSRNSEVQLPPEEHESYDMVNRALAAQFSLASWFEFVMKGRSCQKLADALAADVSRTIVQLSMTGCFGFKDADLQALLRCLPEGLCVLRMDLAFTDLKAPFMFSQFNYILSLSFFQNLCSHIIQRNLLREIEYKECHYI